MKRPLVQGELDCLCGAYSVINSVRLLYDIDDDLQRKLFKAIVGPIYTLDDILNGAEHEHITASLEAVNEVLPTNMQISWTQEREPHGYTLREFFDMRSDRIQSSPVIMGFTGYNEHWTVVQAVTRTSLILFDSFGYKRAKKSDLTWAPEHLQEKVIVEPHDLFTISRKNNLKK